MLGCRLSTGVTSWNLLPLTAYQNGINFRNPSRNLALFWWKYANYLQFSSSWTTANQTITSLNTRFQHSFHTHNLPHYFPPPLSRTSTPISPFSFSLSDDSVDIFPLQDMNLDIPFQDQENDSPLSTPFPTPSTPPMSCQLASIQGVSVTALQHWKIM